jgi:hypothetical protein
VVIAMTKRRLNETGRLMPRDHKILAHVARHRLTTVSVMHQALFPELSHTAVAKVAARLTRHKYLRKYTLRHPVRYFVLGEAGAGLLGLGIHRTESLGPQALPLEYAALLYSTLGKQPRTRLNRGELVGRFPWFLKRWIDGCHCLDERAHVLELLRVDFGGSADHVARRCASDIQLRLQSQDFLKLLTAGRFRLVLITATAEKGAALRRALNRHEWPQGLLLHLSVIPELLIFQGRRTHA